VHGDVAAPAEQRAVLDAEEVGMGLLAYVAAGRGGGGGRLERQAVVLAGEAIGGVHVVINKISTLYLKKLKILQPKPISAKVSPTIMVGETAKYIYFYI